MVSSEQLSSGDDVADSILQLTTEIRRLWQAVNELRDEVFTECLQRRGQPKDPEDAPAAVPPLRLKSMPLDLCDPEFGRKINAAELSEEPATPPERPRAASLAEFVARFTSESPVRHVGVNDWGAEPAANSGVVVTVDDELYEWFEEHFEPQYEHPEGAYVLAGDNGGLFVLWGNESGIFLRQLTSAESEEFDELLRIAREKDARKREQFQVSHADQKQQGCLS